MGITETVCLGFKKALVQRGQGAPGGQCAVAHLSQFARGFPSFHTESSMPGKPLRSWQTRWLMA